MMRAVTLTQLVDFAVWNIVENIWYNVSQTNNSTQYNKGLVVLKRFKCRIAAFYNSLI